MSQPGGWILEVLDRGGRVQQRKPMESGVLAIGRAPDNDIIVDDPFVDPHHAELLLDGSGPRVRDLDSLNGTWLDGRRRVSEARLTHGQAVQLGHSVLRLRSVDAAVPPAWRDATSHGWVAWFRRPGVLALGLLLAAASLVFDAWLEETRRLNPGILANQIAYPLLGLVLWAGLWAGINRISSHRANFGVHLAIGAWAWAILFLGDQLARFLAFAFDWHASASWSLLIQEIAVTGVALFVHLQYVAHGRRPLQALGALTVSAILFGSPVLGDWLRRDDFSPQPFLNPLLLPPAAKIADGRSVAVFLEDAEGLRSEVEVSRQPD